MRFIYFLVFGEYFCSKGVSLSDIGFTLIFLKKSSGSISEEVGEANNASVLAVALDIPVIVAAAGATKVLKSGTTITMDAKRGLVYSGMEEIN